MKSEIVSIFTTNIYRSHNAINEKQRKELVALAHNLSTESCTHTAVNGISYHKHGNFLDLAEELLDSCKNIKQQLLKHINLCAMNYGLSELKINNSWFNIQKKNTQLLRHTHSESIMSGAIYLDVNKNTPPLKFSNPNPFVSYYTQTEIDTPNNWTSWLEYPINRTILVFPSWLQHETEYSSIEDQDRIVLSFNTKKL